MCKRRGGGDASAYCKVLVNSVSATLNVMENHLYAAGLREEFPDVPWQTDVTEAGERVDVATFVAMHMRKMWEHVASSTTAIPHGIIVELAIAGLKDSGLPYARKKLLEDVPVLREKPAWLDELLEWQSDVTALRFAWKQHIVLKKNETVPFRVVRRPGGTRSDACGRAVMVKVRDVDTDEYYAWKSGSVDALTALTQELDIMRGLPQSDHNVSLRASYVMNGRLHLIVTPWAKADLGQFIANPEILPGWPTWENHQKAALLVGWLNCMAVGLAKLHANIKCIVHNDIKPANILLAVCSGCDDYNDDDDTNALNALNARPVFCDFWPISTTQESSKSKTLCYVAPEQLDGRTEANSSPQADVFSLGCVFLELAFMLANKKRKKLTKRLFGFFAGSPAVLDGGLISMLPSSSAFWTDLKDVVRLMLKADPSERPTAHEVARRLHATSVAASIPVHCSL